MLTEAERHEALVAFGVEHYREVYMRLWNYAAKGGRIPGMPELTADEVRQMFDETPDLVWEQLAYSSPALAEKALQDYEKVEAKYVSP